MAGDSYLVWICQNRLQSWLQQSVHIYSAYQIPLKLLRPCYSTCWCIHHSSIVLVEVVESPQGMLWTLPVDLHTILDKADDTDKPAKPAESAEQRCHDNFGT